MILVVCDPPCQNDAPCVANDTCNCNTGYTGSVCESKLSFNAMYNKIYVQELLCGSKLYKCN